MVWTECGAVCAYVAQERPASCLLCVVCCPRVLFAPRPVFVVARLRSVPELTRGRAGGGEEAEAGDKLTTS